MNIFAVSDKPYECAVSLDDKRLRNQTKETAQLLSTAVRVNPSLAPSVNVNLLYLETHRNHPVSRWVRDHRRNFQWTLDLLYMLDREYKYRFDSVHRSSALILPVIPKEPYMTPEVFCNHAKRKDMGLDFTSLPVHEAYRTYLRARWKTDKQEPTWTRCKPGVW